MLRLSTLLPVIILATVIIAIKPGQSTELARATTDEPKRAVAHEDVEPAVARASDRDQNKQIILLDMLKNEDEGEDFFGPVSFDHVAHVSMAGGCENCHHYTPEGQDHPSCRSCHEQNLRREDIRKPSLKGAYHRQCMGCHREWGHDNSCDVCHLPKENGTDVMDVTQLRTYMGQVHPVVAEPEVEIYKTEHPPGALSRVVFDHAQHSERFGFACVECHKSDNCGRCHDSGLPEREPAASVDRHKECAKCHQVDDEDRCAHCHMAGTDSQSKPFDHADTGWPLTPYHADVACRDCHKTVPFTGLDTACGSCHAAETTATGSCRRDQRCIECHNPHESLYDYIRREADADICIKCHQDLMASEGDGTTKHPVGGSMGHELPDVLVNAGARQGEDGSTLTCFTCHSMGTALFEPLPIADGGADGLCLACHESKAGIRGTVHDVHSKTASGNSGTCQTCHPVHGDAPTGKAAGGALADRCTSCHQAGGWAQAMPAPTQSHPDAACHDCHDPHESRFGDFVIKPKTELCVDCHAKQAGVSNGPHARPDTDTTTDGPCLSCHVPHGGTDRSLLRVSGVNDTADGEQVCLGCHEDAGWNASTGTAMIHPREITSAGRRVDSELMKTGEDGRRQIECQSCHDPHGGAEPLHLVRSESDDSSDLCLRCHAEKQYIRHTGHASERLAVLGFATDGCKPCHAMHAARENTWGQMLSPRFLAGSSEDVNKMTKAGLLCVVCHQPDGVAPMPEIATHPPIVLPNVSTPYAPGFLPLFDTDGHVSADGQITCRTCHLAHGRLDLLRLAAENSKLTEQQQRAMRLNLRDFAPPNLCTQCHGDEGRMRFLFFHDPQKREQLRP